MDILMRRPGLATIDWSGVPWNVRQQFEGKVSAVVQSQADAEDLVHFYGHADFCPFADVLILMPGHTAMVIAVDGFVPAAELRDLAVTTWGRAELRLAENGGRLFDFDTLRERHGLARKADLPVLLAEAIQRRIEQHQRSARTDPGRQPDYGPQTRKTFLMGEGA